MKLNPHISVSFDGRCEAAFKFYERCLDATIAFMMTWGGSPMASDAPPGWDDKVAHATLKIGDTVINGSDVPSDRYERPQGFEIVLQMDDPVAAERVFRALAELGEIKWPLGETFWAIRFGVVIDQFGIPWSINCEKAAEPL